MDLEKRRAALRVLSCISDGMTADGLDVEIVKSSVLPDECDLELDEMARTIAERNRYPWNR
jgi:hypothetical protein